MGPAPAITMTPKPIHGNSDRQIVLLPGTGADGRMFDGLRAEFPQIVVPEWPDVSAQPVPSLIEFARCLVRQMLKSGQIASGESHPNIILGGASFGGMLALEVAKIIKPRAVVLMGSCRHPSAVARPLAIVEWLGRPVPYWILERLKFLSGIGGYALGPMEPAHQRLLSQMLRDTPMQFVAWSARAIFEWPGCPDPGVPVLHIHGRRDRVIPAAKVAADVWVDGCGHVPSMTHPQEVCEVLRRACLMPI